MTVPEVATWSETQGLRSEGPRWHEERQELLWAVGTIADRSARRRGRPVLGRGYVLAAGLGFLFVDEAGSVREPAQPEAHRTEARTNDGPATHSAGSGLWYGTPTSGFDRMLRVRCSHR